MSNTVLGLIVGLVLGVAGAFGGLTAFLIVLVLGVVGLLVGRFLDGQLDLDGLTGRGRSSPAVADDHHRAPGSEPRRLSPSPPTAPPQPGAQPGVPVAGQPAPDDTTATGPMRLATTTVDTPRRSVGARRPR